MDWFQHCRIIIIINIILYIVLRNIIISSTIIHQQMKYEKLTFQNHTLNLLYCIRLVQKHSLDVKRQKSKLLTSLLRLRTAIRSLFLLHVGSQQKKTLTYIDLTQV